MDDRAIAHLRETVAAEIARFESESAIPNPDIDLVWSFSGPGTVLQPLKDYEEPWMAWMDANRLQRAILLVHEVTALRIGKPVQRVSRSDISATGPILFYNGIPVEMKAFRTIISLPDFPMPVEKIVTVSEVLRPGESETKDINNTRDQVLSYPRDRFEKPAPTAVGLVSSAAHLPRVLRYINLIRPFEPETQVHCFPIHSDHAWAAIDAVRETERIVAYCQAGHLSAKPYPTNLGLV